MLAHAHATLHSHISLVSTHAIAIYLHTSNPSTINAFLVLNLVPHLLLRAILAVHLSRRAYLDAIMLRASQMVRVLHQAALLAILFTFIVENAFAISTLGTQ